MSLTNILHGVQVLTGFIRSAIASGDLYISIVRGTIVVRKDTGGAAQVVVATSIFPDSPYSRGPGGVSYPCTPRSASHLCTPGRAPCPRVTALLRGIFQKALGSSR